MDDGLQREQSMQRDVMLVATAGASLINGQTFSPYFDPVFFLMRPFVAPLLSSPLVLFYLTSIFISVMTLVIAGVPAAIYERARKLDESSPISIGIWLVATVLLVLPAVLTWFGVNS